MHHIYIADNKNALLKIRSTALGVGLPGPATQSINHPIRGVVPICSKLSISTNNNNEHYEALVKRKVIPRNYNFIPVGSIVVVH